MEFIEYTFPELEEVKAFDSTQKQTLVEELTEMANYQQEMLKIMLEQKVFEAYDKFKPAIEKVIIDPAYQYNDEGYRLENAMVWVDNWTDPCYQDDNISKFQQYLDESLVDISPLMKHVIELDVATLISQYGPKKDLKSSNKSQRYNL